MPALVSELLAEHFAETPGLVAAAKAQELELARATSDLVSVRTDRDALLKANAALTALVTDLRLNIADLMTKLGTAATGTPVVTPTAKVEDKPPVIVVGDTLTTISDLNAFTKPGNYLLAAGAVNLTKGIRPPSGTKLDLGSATINFTGGDWDGVWNCDNQHDVLITGGTYNLPSDKNVILNGSGAAKNIAINNATLAAMSGWGFKLSGGDGYTFDGFDATTWLNYLLFSADGNVKNIVARNWRVKGGSKKESAIRFHRVNGLLIDDVQIDAMSLPGSQKTVAARLHDGQNFTVNNSTFRGTLGLGTMPGGDGGQQWGVTVFIDKNGAWTNDKSKADAAKTRAKRDAELAVRLTHVRLKNVNVTGDKVDLNPGLIDCEWDGGTITVANTCFTGSLAYPTGKASDSTLLKDDAQRGKPQIIARNVACTGQQLDPTGIVQFVASTFNGKAVA